MKFLKFPFILTIAATFIPIVVADTASCAQSCALVEEICEVYGPVGGECVPLLDLCLEECQPPNPDSPDIGPSTLAVSCQDGCSAANGLCPFSSIVCQDLLGACNLACTQGQDPPPPPVLTATISTCTDTCTTSEDTCNANPLVSDAVCHGLSYVCVASCGLADEEIKPPVTSLQGSNLCIDACALARNICRSSIWTPNFVCDAVYSACEAACNIVTLGGQLSSSASLPPHEPTSTSIFTFPPLHTLIPLISPISPPNSTLIAIIDTVIQTRVHTITSCSDNKCFEVPTTTCDSELMTRTITPCEACMHTTTITLPCPICENKSTTITLTTDNRIVTPLTPITTGTTKPIITPVIIPTGGKIASSSAATTSYVPANGAITASGEMATTLGLMFVAVAALLTAGIWVI